MPKSAQAYKKLAHEVNNAVYQHIISSNDIIDRTQLPFLYETEFENYREKFGVSRFSDYMAYQNEINTLRTQVQQRVKACQSSSPMFLQSLSVAMLGYGECHENGTMAAAELMKRGETDFDLTLLQGQVFFTPYYHQIVILGNRDKVNWQAASIEDMFKNTGDDCIVIDSFRNHVGLARNYADEQKSYLTAFNYSHQIQSATFTPEIAQKLPALIQSAEQICQKLADDQAYTTLQRAELSKYKHPLKPIFNLKDALGAHQSPPPTFFSPSAVISATNAKAPTSVLVSTQTENLATKTSAEEDIDLEDIRLRLGL